jgi:8-oxo-dGTP pyrophosphatase MutT (NUDIX family)
MDVCLLRHDDRVARTGSECDASSEEVPINASAEAGPAPRVAATIALVRDGHEGIEVWMMRRVSAMSFASGALVFPGGGVDPQDTDPRVRWSGGTVDALSTRLGLDEVQTRALVNAAARELFEEAGVLISRSTHGGDWTADRRAIEARTTSMADLLAAGDDALDVSRLIPWARWVTPPSEPRRYDTWFFVSPAPAGLDSLTVSGEADAAAWYAPAAVLDLAERKVAVVLPPTIVMLRALIAAGSVAEVMRAAPDRPLAPVHPRVRDNHDGTLTVLGGGEEVVVRP